MNRIESFFQSCKESGKKALVGYLTAGDPDMERSEANVRAALTHGVDVLELGVPFSDPTADGPTIQAASHRALAADATLSKVLGMVRRLRVDFDQPIVLFGYCNPLFSYGYADFCRDAKKAGADGLLVVDLPFEMTPELQNDADIQDLVLIPLVAPTTPPDRAATILKDSRGFVYYIMVKGVTGAREVLVTDLGERVDALRTVTSLPIAAGFGVSSGDQAGEVAKVADAVVVGSALVKAAEAGQLEALVTDLRRGLDGVQE